MTKTFAQKIAEQERNDDSDSSIKGMPEGVSVEIDVKTVEKTENVRKTRKSRQKKVVEKPVVSEKPVVKPVEKIKRAPSAYNLFVKESYKLDEVQKLPPKDRFSAVASLWQKQKEKKSK